MLGIPRFPSDCMGMCIKWKFPWIHLHKSFSLSFDSYRNFFENHIPGLVLNSGSLSDFWSPGYIQTGTDLFSVGPELYIAVTGMPWEIDPLGR